MKKIFSLIAAVLFAGSMMAADATIAKGTTNSYDDVTVNGKAAVKMGKSGAGGNMTITVGANAATLTLHAAAWKGEGDQKVTITAPAGVTVTPDSIVVAANNAFSGTGKAFTGITEADYAFTLTLAGVGADGAVLTLESAKRAFVWEAKWYVAGETPDPEPVVPQAENLGPKTIAEFLALKNTTDTCVLTGVIDSLVNTTYGNFNLVDATGKVYVYGLLNAAGQAQKFAELGLVEGDTITVKALYNEYQGAPQAKNAIFVSAKRQPAPSPIDHTYFAYDNDWKPDTLSSATWDGVNKKVIVNIALAKQAAWQAQVFVQDILGKAGYEYAVSLKMKANKAINGVTVKYQDQPEGEPMLYMNAIALAANTEFVLDTAHLVGNDGNGKIVFDFGFAPAETVIEIYDIQITETKLATMATCAEVYSMQKNDPVALGNVTVTYASGKNVWVKDATGSMLIYLSADATWKAGDVLAGVAGTVDIYNGVYEVKPSAEQVAAVVATAGEAPAPEELTAVAAADMNKYIVVKGIAFEQDAAFVEGTASNITIKVGGNDIVLRNNFKNAYAFQAGKAYDIIAVVTIYQSNPQLYFISASEAQGIENIELTEQAQKVMVDGIMYIVRDGKMFNAQGIQVR